MELTLKTRAEHGQKITMLDRKPIWPKITDRWQDQNVVEPAQSVQYDPTKHIDRFCVKPDHPKIEIDEKSEPKTRPTNVQSSLAPYLKLYRLNEKRKKIKELKVKSESSHQSTAPRIIIIINSSKSSKWLPPPPPPPLTGAVKLPSDTTI